MLMSPTARTAASPLGACGGHGDGVTRPGERQLPHLSGRPWPPIQMRDG